MPETVELRVHGVHGTSPGSMLGVADGEVGQVAGDRLTGIYRLKKGDPPLRDLAGRGVAVEAYSWGSLTSGVQGLFGWVRRALWLLLLPFALANLSYWARLRLAEDTATARWGARATRIGALLLTVFMVLTPALIGIDLVAWQCYRGGSPGCPAIPGFLDFLARLDAAQRLAVGSLLPLAVIAALWFLSRQTLLRYEEIPDDAGRVAAYGVLAHPRLWSGWERTAQLQKIHLTVALSTVVCFSGVHVLAVAGPDVYFVIMVAGAAATALASFAWVCLMHPDDIDYFHDTDTRLVSMRRKVVPKMLRGWVRDHLPDELLRLAATATLGQLVGLLLVPVDLGEGDFVGHNLWFIGAFVALTAVHLAVFTGGRMRAVPAVLVSLAVFGLAGLALVANDRRGLDAATDGGDPVAYVALGIVALLWVALTVWHSRQGERHPSAAWNGAGASVLLAAAAWVGLLFTTGVVTVTANYLNGPDHGFDDFVSRSSPTAVEAAEAYPQSTAVPLFTAAGEVTAVDAVVRVAGDGSISVATGTVTMDSLYQDSRETSGPRADLARALNTTRVRTAVLDLPAPGLAVRDSCVRAPTDPDAACSAESADFVPDGTLPLASSVLGIEAADGPVTLAVGKPPQMPLVLPQVLIWSPLLQLLWLVLVVAFVVGAALRFRKAHDALDSLLVADTEIPVRDRAACRKARRTAAFAHRAERLLDGIGSVTAVVAIVLICASATGQAPWDLLPWTRDVATVSMYVSAGLGAALIFVAAQIRTSDSTRRSVGVLWDLTTFWPRAAHPLAPPCYAERVVPELRTRLTWALTDPDHDPVQGPDPRADNTVVLSAHSQGSAIAVAVVSRLPRALLGRVRVATYGSQIRALYGRVFPGVFGPEQVGYVATPGPATFDDAYPDAPTGRHPRPAYVVPAEDPNLPDQDWRALPTLGRVFTAGGRWVNLFRRTDPLGFRVFSDADATPDHVVPEVPPRRVGDPGPAVQGHSGYQHSLAYRRTVAAWTGETPVEPARDTQDVPLLPQP